MFDTLLGILGLAYQAVGNRNSEKQLRGVQLELDDTKVALNLIQRDVHAHIQNSRFLEASILTQLSDPFLIDRIAVKLFRRLAHLADESGQTPWLVVVDPMEVEYRFLEPSQQVLATGPPAIIFSPTLYRLPQISPYGFSSVVDGRPAERHQIIVHNPEPAVIRLTHPWGEHDKWSHRLAELAEPSIAAPEFFIDETYWRKRLTELRGEQK